MDVVLFGAGKNLIDHYDEFFGGNYNIVAIVDNHKAGTRMENGIVVERPSLIRLCNYDVIIITLVNQNHILEVLHQLKDMGVSEDKVWYMLNDRFCPIPKKQGLDRKNMVEPYVFFEVTNMTLDDYGTGIQRTVKRLYSELKSKGAGVLPIRYFGKFITSYEYDYKYGVYQEEYDGTEYTVDFQRGDIVFFPDTSWSLEITESSFEYIHESGAISIFMLYDLIPIRKREFVTDLHFRLFNEWLNRILTYADAVICISKAVADDLAAYYKETSVNRKGKLPLYVNYLGYDISDKKGDARDEMKAFVQPDKTFLMVGTVQPLKNHMIALNALKVIDSSISEIKLLILGKQTDLMPEFGKFIEENDELRCNVLWIKDATDEEVVWAYNNCRALLFPSQAEGFGLPLVEAASYNLPILCSDIPIFREIAGENATYFKVNDATDLTKVIIDWLNTEHPTPSKELQRHTWNESAEGIVRIFENIADPYIVLN